MQIEKDYDNGAGKLIVNADAQGNVTVSNTFNQDVAGLAQVSSQVSVTSNIFSIAEKIAAQTQTTWDDTAIAALKSLLGIVDPPASPVLTSKA